MEKLLEAKKKASKLKEFLEFTVKKVKVKPAKYDETIKVIDAFLNCYLRDKAIHKRYNELKQFIQNV